MTPLSRGRGGRRASKPEDKARGRGAGLSAADFRVSGTGHERIEQLFQDGCAERVRRFTGYNEKQLERRITMWLCQNASSFVMFDTKARATVIGLERDDDAEAFRREFIR